MTYYIVKIVVTTALVVGISELSKRSSFAGAVLASVPVVSVLAMLWLFRETHDAAQVAALSRSVLWLVPPSLVLFALLPGLLVRGYNFYLSLALSIVATVAVYAGAVLLARRLGASL
jgi:hypothetical protein